MKQADESLTKAEPRLHPTWGAQNVCMYQSLRWLLSLKNRSVSTPIHHSRACTLDLAEPKGTPVSEQGPGRHWAQRRAIKLSISFLSAFANTM